MVSFSDELLIGDRGKEAYVGLKHATPHYPYVSRKSAQLTANSVLAIRG